MDEVVVEKSAGASRQRDVPRLEKLRPFDVERTRCGVVVTHFKPTRLGDA
jgi:hypothetical protein